MLTGQEEHKNPRQGIIPENSRVKCFKCKESGHLSRECPRKKTPDEELLFHKKRVDAENVAVEEDSSREPDKVTTDVAKTDGNNLDHQGQKRPDPLVNVDDERPYILSVRQASRRSEDDPCVNFDNVMAGPDILPGLRKFRQANDDHVENMGDGGVDKQSDILVERLTSQRAGEDVRESGDSDEDAISTEPLPFRPDQRNMTPAPGAAALTRPR
ncbi:hypothetical protein HPB47_008165 [Ixodes persulcatus]|uniref:Uncharacterized protein n=1 Tax=Ixodes persulcatus TaxID=34615 RepID=A0AC60P5F6_IXOPE|nr:hypothetical protein HPB47_008165 [Ixodes persulcatus]